MPGALLVTGAGMLTSGAVVALSRYGEDAVYLFNAAGPLSLLPAEYKAQLKGQHGWRICDAAMKHGKIELM